MIEFVFIDRLLVKHLNKGGKLGNLIDSIYVRNLYGKVLPCGMCRTYGERGPHCKTHKGISGSVKVLK